MGEERASMSSGRREGRSRGLKKEWQAGGLEVGAVYKLE
jgi:hypothetical protein